MNYCTCILKAPKSDSEPIVLLCPPEIAWVTRVGRRMTRARHVASPNAFGDMRRLPNPNDTSHKVSTGGDHAETELICLPFRNVTGMCIGLSERCRLMCQEIRLGCIAPSVHMLICVWHFYPETLMSISNNKVDTSCWPMSVYPTLFNQTTCDGIK